MSADDTVDSAVRACLAAMVWGHGRNGYGAYRTVGFLTATDHAGARLQEAMQVARAEGGPAGFAYLARHRLKGLGVAFATKYLYFCLANGENASPAPILDSVVCDFIATHTRWRPRLNWKIEDYKRYCGLVSEWSAQLEELPATVEYLMFASGIGIASQWGLLALADSVRTTGGPASDLAAVLNALDKAAEAFSLLPSPGSTDDADAFRQGVHTLRQIALRRARS